MTCTTFEPAPCATSESRLTSSGPTRSPRCCSTILTQPKTHCRHCRLPLTSCSPKSTRQTATPSQGIGEPAVDHFRRHHPFHLVKPRSTAFKVVRLHWSDQSPSR